MKHAKVEVTVNFGEGDDMDLEYIGVSADDAITLALADSAMEGRHDWTSIILIVVKS